MMRKSATKVLRWLDHIHILDQEEVEALKSILRLVLEAQKLLLEANRRLRLYTEGYKELDNWFLV